ncbi:putative Fe-S oxidoreductase [Fructobacillus fructosus]|nr:putative Fe-S oxidoreductase [Fructobacillus fructosus]
MCLQPFSYTFSLNMYTIITLNILHDLKEKIHKVVKCTLKLNQRKATDQQPNKYKEPQFFLGDESV